MWRPQAAGELYTYLPPYTVKGFEANGHFCKDKNTECNPTYGASIGRGDFHFKAGAWTTVAERVKLNTPGKADGEIELYVEGKSTIKVTGIIIRDSGNGRIRGLQMQSFFGGSFISWQIIVVSLTHSIGTNRQPTKLGDSQGSRHLFC